MLKWLKWLNILRFLFSNEWVDFPQMLSFKKSTVIKKLLVFNGASSKFITFSFAQESSVRLVVILSVSFVHKFNSRVFTSNL